MKGWLRLLDRKFLLCLGMLTILGMCVWYLRGNPEVLDKLAFALLGGVSGYITGRFASQTPGQDGG